MNDLTTFTSAAADAVDAAETVGELSLYASTVETISEFAGEHPIATCIVAGVAVAGVSYVAYKGLRNLFTSANTGEAQ